MKHAKCKSVRATFTNVSTRCLFNYNGSYYAIRFDRAMGEAILKKHIGKEIERIDRGLKRPIKWSEVEKWFIL